MKIAKSDYTYCTSSECVKKCDRHISNYEFNEKEIYSFYNECDINMKEVINENNRSR